VEKPLQIAISRPLATSVPGISRILVGKKETIMIRFIIGCLLSLPLFFISSRTLEEVSGFDY
jgi:hypothetical protein